MKLKFYDSSNYGKSRNRHSDPTVIIFNDGKLVINVSACKLLNLKRGNSINIGVDENNESNDLYLKVNQTISKDAFRVSIYGSQLYINSKSLFDSLGYDYKNKIYKYDISFVEKNIYLMVRRQLIDRYKQQ